MNLLDKKISEIDWATFGAVNQTCYCRCGAIYRSHSKLAPHWNTFVIVNKEPCPSCGKSKGNCFKVSSDPETMSL